MQDEDMDRVELVFIEWMGERLLAAGFSVGVV
jgi:hypothetical protein